MKHSPFKLCSACLLIVSTCSAFAITIKDDVNQQVSLKQPAKRIISLSPHTAELVYAASAGNKLVGVSYYSDYPPEVINLPQIGGINGLDKERVLSLNPDLAIAWSSGNKPQDIAWLKSQGIAVYQVEPGNLNAIADNIQAIGLLAGSAEKAKAAAKHFLKQLEQSCPEAANQPVRSVFYEIWNPPLMTIGGKHWLNDVLQHLGLKNIFSDQSRDILTISQETLLLRNADYYLGNKQSQPPPNSRLIILNSLIARPTPRILEGIQLLCQQLQH